MTKKIISFVLVSVFALGAALFVGTPSAHAQVATYPDGCGAAVGYSATTGLACSGTGTVIPSPMPGCTTALGYSATNGAPCSGGSTALIWLAGCTSLIGYSDASGAPCNGTLVATPAPTSIPAIPGLPSTGAGGNATRNVTLLLLSGGLAVLGVAYAVNRSRYAQK